MIALNEETGAIFGLIGLCATAELLAQLAGDVLEQLRLDALDALNERDGLPAASFVLAAQGDELDVSERQRGFLGGVLRGLRQLRGVRERVLEGGELRERVCGEPL